MMLTKDFFNRDTIDVAKDLLGKTLVRNTDSGQITGRIVETEAYLGFDDPGCHAFRGKTARNAVMFDEAGKYYVYFIYGMYFCLNMVTRQRNIPEAVLIRAVMPLSGLDIMQSNRPKVKNLKNLANGPGKLTVAFEIDKSFNGLEVTDRRLYLLDDGYVIHGSDIITSTRIGLKDGAELPLRFYPKTLEEFVSKK